MLLPTLPPAALQWSVAASTAAAISYADRGTSAIAASSLLDELHWTESQLGEVQSSFFIGYALTQVLGGILGGEDSSSNDDESGKSGGYRTILPLSLFLSGIVTMLFPIAATIGGPTWASIDRFCLGLLEGLLLPSAMAGVSATTTSSVSSKDMIINNNEGGSNKATASALVIAGCYLGSAWAYLSAWALFSENFQVQAQLYGYHGSIWPLVFYFNGLISMTCLFLFRDEFNMPTETWISNIFQSSDESKAESKNESIQNELLEDTISIAKTTLSSKSGRAILAAQVGQGALLYSIASWGPLYLERVQQSTANDIVDIASSSAQESIISSSSSSISIVAVAASIAAFSLILPQITQAFVGVSIGAVADQLSANIGTRITRRTLQIISGVGPAIVLWYLSQSSDVNNAELISPAFLFGAAQTINALSLGAVSVSHLDIATPSKAGSVYALGNVAAAASGSLMVNIFGRLLDDGASTDMSGVNEFSLPFQVVAILSAIGSLIYGFTVETELEIGSTHNQTAVV